MLQNPKPLKVIVVFPFDLVYKSQEYPRIYQPSWQEAGMERDKSVKSVIGSPGDCHEMDCPL